MLSRMFLMLALAIAPAATARAESVAAWTFDRDATDQVGGLEAVATSDGARVADGVLRLDNAGRTDRDGAAMIVPDAPQLTGHADGGAGHASLVIEADIKPARLGEQMQVVRKTDGDVGYELYVTKDGKIGFRIKTDKGLLVVTSKNRVAADGKWHHLEAVWDASVNLYNCHVAVNGVVTWAARELGTLTDTDAPLVIGGLYRGENNIGQRFAGEIDNVAISVNRPELLHATGKIDPTPAEPTGLHLRDQPGFLAARFVVDPPVTPECHAPTLAERPDGAIVGVWFGGTREGHIDAGAWQSTFESSTWSPPREVAHGTYDDGSPSATFNPVLFQYPDNGPMLLFFMSGHLGTAKGNLQVSHDGGRTWSPPRRLPDGIRGATKNKPVLLPDGTLVCPDNSSKLKFDRTRDFGETWLTSGIAPGDGIDGIQPTILTHRDGRLQALARSRTGAIVQTWSDDGGATWSPLEKTSLPNNYSGIDAVTLDDGRHLLVYNHATIPDGRWGGPRTPLNVAVSNDGVNWSAALVLEDEPGEYSYPAVIQTSDGKVHVLYTWHRVRVKHVELDPSRFEPRPIVNGQWP